jgi:preprotein translocase subunit SecG
MTGIFMFFHGLVCVLLVLVILMQSGRGGGLTEGFASAESIFGAKTNAFMVKATTILGTVFLVTCLSLAVLSSQKGKSLMEGKKITSAPVQTAQTTQAVEPGAQAPAPEPVLVNAVAAEE